MKVDYWHNFQEGLFYHIYNHSSGEKNLFGNDHDYQDFLAKYNRYFSTLFDTYAYCLMPNHFHLIVQVRKKEMILAQINTAESSASLALYHNQTSLNEYIQDQFRRYFSSYTLAYNHRNKTRGQLFLKRMKRISFDPDAKLAYLICYAHHNPIHHRFAKSYEIWKYSSYQFYCHNEPAAIENMKRADEFISRDAERMHHQFRMDRAYEVHTNGDSYTLE
ncbi:MAG: hypothetical protein HKN87_16225 [Saprospiraceae bacterium]|nr:hypothetical protein [Saprospiraceae bacterium]